MLRPVDMVLSVQNTADGHRSGTSESGAGRSEVAAQMFADRLEKQARLQEQQVQNPHATEKNEVNPDDKGHGGGYQPNRRRNAKRPEKGKFAGDKEMIKESMYDIKI